ncbi:MAG: sensor histidine kinase [Polyangiaceae bacterium]|nr:sensor histidine kinase [Polyangiaceae bacterium]
MRTAGDDPTLDLAGALHEVSNALTVVLGWTEAAAQASDPEALRNALGIIKSRAALARDIARQAIGAVVPSPPPAPIADVIRDAAHALTFEAAPGGVTISVSDSSTFPNVVVPSAPALLQVVTNLLLNAIAFSPPGSRVDISVAEAPDHCVLIAVQDAGPGVPVEQRERLFQSGVSSRRGGAGVGLRHSAALAAAHGGALRLGEQGPVGARFELVWPTQTAEFAAQRPPQSAPRPIEHTGNIQGARILIVEDDDAVIELLMLALEARGADVVSVKQRADLPRALSTGRFDAALLDLSPLLGDLDGAVAALRDASPAARLVVMSGSVPQANVGGAAHWVRKPFEVREIVDALSGVVAAQKASNQKL